MSGKASSLIRIGSALALVPVILTGLRLTGSRAFASTGADPWPAVLRTEVHGAVPSHAAPVTAQAAPRRLRGPVLPTPRIPTYLPIVDHPDIHLEHKIIASAVLRMIPSDCRKNLKNFYVRYDNPKERGLAGKNSIVLSGNVSDNEFRALLIHEAFGHMVDLGCMTGNSETGPSGFRDSTETIYEDDPSVGFYQISWLSERRKRQDARTGDFVTGYAAADAFEDFAESVTFYVLQKEAFRGRAETNLALAMKLAWIEENLFPQGIAVAEGTYVWHGKDVPWDATKLSYVWKGRTEMAQIR